MDIYQTGKYDLLSVVQKEFINDINNVFMKNRFESDLELILAFEGMKPTWNSRLNSIVVYNTITVYKSSYIFWRNFFKYIDNSFLRETCWEAIAKLGTGDATGGLWGSLGGPGVALLGAVGGYIRYYYSMSYMGIRM